MPKSPVPTHFRKNAGNRNLKGKKGTFGYTCGCCEMLGYLKDKELNKISRKEMRDDINNYYMNKHM